MNVRGGGPISLHGAVWSADGRHVLAPAGASVRVYAADSGRDAPVGLLRGHAADVTGVARHPVDDGKVYTASLDGTLKTWDLATCRCVATVAVGAPVTGLAVPPRAGAAWLSTAWERGAGRIFRVKLATGAVDGERFKLAAPGGLTLSGGGGVVAAYEKRTLWLWRADGDLHAPVVVTHTKAVTSLAVDADDDHVAAGDVTGRITVWRGLAAALGRGGGAAASGGSATASCAAAPPSSPLPPPRTLHWHSAAVLALDFTTDGEFLVSGGHEGVLAAWQLAGGGRTFLPRLGGALTCACAAPPRSARGGTILTAHADNTLRVVNLATASVEWSVAGLRPRPRGARGVAGVRCGALALATRGGGLQFWDLATDRHAGSLAVVPRTDVNALPAGGGGGVATAPPPGGPRVTAVSFSAGGAAAVTVDARASPGAPGGRASSLKMWVAPDVQAAGAAPLVLAAEVVDAHSGIITGMAVTPDGGAVVTGGADGDLKLWERRPATTASSASTRWRCGWSARLRGAPFAAVDISTDGSLVVGAAGSDVGAWRCADGDRVAVVPPPPAARGGPAVAVALIPASPILVIAYGGGAPCVAGWDLVRGRHAWCAPRARALRLTAAPAPSRLLALALEPPDGAAPDASPPGGRVVILEAATGAAVSGWDLPRCGADALVWLPPARAGGALATAAAAVAGSSPPLLIVTGDREYCVAPSPAAVAAGVGEEPCPALASPADTLPPGPTPLAAAVGVGVALADDVTPAIIAKRAGRAPAWGSLFDAPSHALPPPSALAPRFLEALLLGGVEQ